MTDIDHDATASKAGGSSSPTNFSLNGWAIGAGVTALGVLAVVVVAASASSSGPVDDACDLLTLGELRSATGVTFLQGQGNAYGDECLFPAEGASHKTVRVSLKPIRPGGNGGRPLSGKWDEGWYVQSAAYAQKDGREFGVHVSSYFGAESTTQAIVLLRKAAARA